MFCAQNMRFARSLVWLRNFGKYSKRQNVDHGWHCPRHCPFEPYEGPAAAVAPAAPAGATAICEKRWKNASKKRFAEWKSNWFDFDSDIDTLCPVGFDLWSDSIRIRMTLQAPQGFLRASRPMGFMAATFAALRMIFCNHESLRTFCLLCVDCVLGVGRPGYFIAREWKGTNHVIYHAILPIFPLCALTLFHLFFSCIGLDLSSVKRPKQKEVRKCNCFEIALRVKMTVF